MDLVALKAEITTDPIARGYSAMTDEAIAISLNKRDRTTDNETINGGDVAACIDLVDWALMSQSVRDYYSALVASAGIPNTVFFRGQLKSTVALTATFTGQTRNKINAMLRRTGSRAEELGLGSVTPSDVADAKRS